MIDDDSENEQELHEISQEIGEKIVEIAEKVHPLRVALAGVVMLLILGALVSTWYWVIPRDDVEIDVVYLQRNGHIVMVELFNDGSREITDVNLKIDFVDSDNKVLQSIDVSFDKLSSHTSVSGDEMEMNVKGYTVWSTYTIVIDITWTNFKDVVNQETKSFQVSETQTAQFTHDCEEVTWFF
ncbi:MAG: hypothetical protein CMB16_01900 [Euryarchaeota archaeon]|nr:hypothetical protein [Euryarchaeota archaeon]|tara:strand:- start:33 stop:581 length:549 start_codon:yes stop_codon:yes gene_type:complete